MSENLREKFIETPEGKKLIELNKERNAFLIQTITPELFKSWGKEPKFFRYKLRKNDNNNQIYADKENKVKGNAKFGYMFDDTTPITIYENLYVIGSVPQDILLFKRKGFLSNVFGASSKAYDEGAKDTTPASGGKRKTARKRKNSYRKKTRRTRKK
jgi:hypothetical protein